MTEGRKYVASRTITPRWNDTHLLKGGLVEAVRALKQQEGAGLTLLGSGNVATQLGEAGLVAEYQLVVLPIALGKGRTVFTKPETLRLTDHRAFKCGNVVLTYAT